MTGRDGIRRAVSLPPGAATDQAVTAMRQAAVAELARPITEVVTGVAEPFVQVVYDIAVPRMAFGRACLIGDAAFAVRPHAAAGTAKAAADGWALADRTRVSRRGCAGRAGEPGNASRSPSAAPCSPGAAISATARSSMAPSGPATSGSSSACTDRETSDRRVRRVIADPARLEKLDLAVLDD